MRRGAVPLALALLLAACTTPPPAKPQGPAPVTSYPGGGECRMAGAQFAVGQQADAALQREAARRSGAAQVRILRPSQAITMEFNAQRLNLEVDAGNRVLAVRCG